MGQKDQVSEAVREKAQKNLAAFLGEINRIHRFDEEDESINTPEDIRNDDSDGVPCRLLSDIEEIDKERINAIMRLDNVVDDEPADDDFKDITEAEIDRKIGSWGYTHLHYAVMENNIDLVKELLSKGAKPAIKDHSGQSPRDKALACGFMEIANLLAQAVAK